jgi:hypothetical protein
MSVKIRLERLEANRKHEAQAKPDLSGLLWLFSTGTKPEVLDGSAKPWLREHVGSTKGDVVEWLHGH